MKFSAQGNRGSRRRRALASTLALPLFITLIHFLSWGSSALAAGPFASSPTTTAKEIEKVESGIRLILLIVVDQLRADRLTGELPGGLGRIARDGRVYRDALLAHAVSETCPGHATLLSGRYPGSIGIPSNRYIERETGRTVYCVEDRRPGAAVFGGTGEPEKGRSPAKMRFDGFARWLKDRYPESRVMSVSGTDRAAIATAGRNADAAYWFSKESGFTTSRHYTASNALPGWVLQWHGKDSLATGMLEAVPDLWKHTSNAPGPHGRLDKYRGESDELSRVSGHPLRDSDIGAFLNNIYASPYLDQLTLAFASKLIEQENLGGGDAPDLLVVSLSATDIVGHMYGPESHESRDALARLDSDLSKFLGGIEARVGREGLFVVLTADHGVMVLPEWLHDTGRSECPVEGGVLSIPKVVASLSWNLHSKHGPLISIPRMWFAQSGLGLTFDRKLAADRGVAIKDLSATAKEVLERQPGIRHVWTEAEIEEDPGETAELYRHSFDPKRSADIYIELDPTCLLRSKSTGTTHGSPHLYDRAVPFVFMGPGVQPGQVSGTVGTVDLAPTLIEVMGLEPVAGLDGHALDLRAPAK